MPNRSGRPCAHSGCRKLTTSGPHCADHFKPRESSTARGYDGTWWRLRAAHLAEHPMCGVAGCLERATDVDHIKAHRGNEALRLDPRNLASMCHAHHSSKTVRADGGFGREPRRAR